MDGLDTSGLLPGDILAALRSFPRRFDSALDPGRFPAGDDADPLRARDRAMARPGPDGRTGLQHLAMAQAAADAADRSIATLALGGGGILDDPRASWTSGQNPPSDVELLRHNLTESLERVANRLGQLASEAWGAGGTTRGGQSTSVLDLARNLVGDIAAHLRHLERCAATSGDDA